MLVRNDFIMESSLSQREEQRKVDELREQAKLEYHYYKQRVTTNNRNPVKMHAGSTSTDKARTGHSLVII